MLSNCGAGEDSWESLVLQGNQTRRKWQSTPGLLPGKSQGQRSLVGYSPWGRKELNTTEWLHFPFTYGVRRWSSFILLQVVDQFFEHHLLKRLSFLHCIFLPPLSKISEVAQSCLTICDPMDCSPPGFSVHGSFQARVLEWAVISFSRGSSWFRDQTQVSCIAGRFFTIWSP